jgi:hypothetical protein
MLQAKFVRENARDKKAMKGDGYIYRNSMMGQNAGPTPTASALE